MKKKCKKCSIEKPLDEYYSDNRLKDGKMNICRECHLESMKSRYTSTKEQLPENVKRCTCCGELKDRKGFYKHGKSVTSRCKECIYKTARKKNIESYGITELEYVVMYNLQNGVCYICGNDNGSKKLCIDHDHDTGEVRALLCDHCNTGLGKFKDNKKLLQKAVKYLTRHGK